MYDLEHVNRKRKTAGKPSLTQRQAEYAIARAPEGSNLNVYLIGYILLASHEQNVPGTDDKPAPETSVQGGLTAADLERQEADKQAAKMDTGRLGDEQKEHGVREGQDLSGPAGDAGGGDTSSDAGGSGGGE